jgi:hypothetical protein
MVIQSLILAPLTVTQGDYSVCCSGSTALIRRSKWDKGSFATASDGFQPTGARRSSLCWRSRGRSFSGTRMVVLLKMLVLEAWPIAGTEIADGKGQSPAPLDAAELPCFRIRELR